MISPSLPSQAYLRECFDYDPATGVLRWRERPREHFGTIRGWRVFNSKFAGRECATVNSDGYVKVWINGHHRYAHRVIWKLMMDEEPATIDHRDHEEGNNAFANLRPATKAENGGNMRVHSKRTAPGSLKGAYAHREKWHAQIGIDRKTIYLGTFDTEQAAHEAYCAAAKEHFGEFWRAG